MKNVLLTFALLLTFGLSYGQIKVVTSGDVGIGSSTPVGKLNVVGTSQLEFALDASAGNPDFTLQVAGASKAQFKYNVGLQGVQIGADDANTGNAGIGGTDLFVSGAASGNVGIGTATPSAKLHVNGGINYNGALTNVSDRRLKKNTSEFNYGLNEVLALNPINYQYNGKAGIDNDGKFIGLFAQELQDVAPSLVSSWTYTEFAKQTAEEMAQEKAISVVKTEEYLQINESAIKYMLINAVQEQQIIIDVQNERITKLEQMVLNLANGATTQAVEIRDSRLGQNAPNPFTQATVINYAVPTKAQTAVMQVFDMNGQLLKSVNVANGNGELTINAGELAAGTYSYNLVVDGKVVDTKKMVLTK